MTKKELTKKEKEKQMSQNILIGGAAVGGVLLLSSFSSSAFGTTNSTVPNPPIDPDGQNPNNYSDYGTGAGQEGATGKDYINYGRLLELGLGVIAGIIIKFSDIREAWKDLREKEEEEQDENEFLPGEGNFAMGDFNDFGFYNANLFSQPGDWLARDGIVEFGVNPGGAFNIETPQVDFNHKLSSTNFSLDGFNDLFKNTNLRGGNLFRSDGSWDYTQGHGNSQFLSGLSGLKGIRDIKPKYYIL